MLDFIVSHAGDIANFVVILGPIAALFICIYRYLHSDNLKIRQDISEVNKNIQNAHSRIDAMGVRIDNLYNIMIEMLRGKK